MIRCGGWRVPVGNSLSFQTSRSAAGSEGHITLINTISGVKLSSSILHIHSRIKKNNQHNSMCYNTEPTVSMTCLLSVLRKNKSPILKISFDFLHSALSYLEKYRLSDVAACTAAIKVHISSCFECKLEVKFVTVKKV